MHDHIEEMGKNIACREHLDEPRMRSRLWVQEEIEHVLVDNSGIKAARCIDLRFTPSIYLKGLRNMKNLRCLIVNNINSMNKDDDHVKTGEACLHFPYSLQYMHWFKYPHFPNSLQYLYWYGYPHRCLPKMFEASNLVSLEMPESKIKQLWEKGKVMEKLKFLDLSFTRLRSLDLGLTPNLKRLDLQFCEDLVKLKVYGGCLKSLVYLNLNGCDKLKSISFIEKLESLEVLNIGALNLREFPGYSNSSLLELTLKNNYDIEEIPSSIGSRVSLSHSFCKRLKSLPGSICSLRHLRTLNLSYNYRIEELPEELGQLECLEYLDLQYTKVKHLPGSICMLKRLKAIILQWCTLLEKLPEDVGQLESLEKLDLRFCYNLREIPSSICKLKHLKKLNLKSCERLEKLPEELGNLGCLQSLDIRETGITHLPRSISLFKDLKIKKSEN